MSSRLRQPLLIITMQFCVSCFSASYFAVGGFGGYLVLQGNAALTELTHIFGANRLLFFFFLMRGQFVHAFASELCRGDADHFRASDIDVPVHGLSTTW